MRPAGETLTGRFALKGVALAVQLSIASDVAALRRHLSAVEQRQIPFAVARGLTVAAKEVAADITADLPSIFDRPTPFTKRAIGSTRASKTRLTASVFVKRVQAAYLGIQETGGERRPKGRAIVMPAAERLNQYGNLPRRRLQTLLRQKAVFVATIAGTHGVWKRPARRGGRPTLLIAFEASTTYRPRFAFVDRVTASARKAVPPALARSLADALRTARP